MQKVIFIIVTLISIETKAVFEPLPTFDNPISFFTSVTRTGLSGGFETHIAKQTALDMFGDFAGGKLMELKPSLSAGLQVEETKEWDAYLSATIKTYIKSQGGTALKLFFTYARGETNIFPLAYVFLRSPYSLFSDSDMLIVFGGVKGERVSLEELSDKGNFSKAFSFFESLDKVFAGFTYYPNVAESSWSFTLTGSKQAFSLAFSKGF